MSGSERKTDVEVLTLGGTRDFRSILSYRRPNDQVNGPRFERTICAETRSYCADPRMPMPNDYIAATRLCDCDNPSLRRVAQQITGDAGTTEEKALRVFLHVRDHIRFGLAYSRSRASRTLKRGYGECGNKTNAQVALLRAAGVPARFRWAQARTEILHHLIAKFVYDRMPPVASHFWCECYLAGRWMSCDLLLDKPLYHGMLKQGLVTKGQVPTIDWDGRSDLVLLKPWLTEDRGELASFDDAIGVLVAREEGMPPLWIEWLVAPIFYPLSLRSSDRIRRLAVPSN